VRLRAHLAPLRMCLLASDSCPRKMGGCHRDVFCLNTRARHAYHGLSVFLTCEVCGKTTVPEIWFFENLQGNKAYKVICRTWSDDPGPLSPDEFRVVEKEERLFRDVMDHEGKSIVLDGLYANVVLLQSGPREEARNLVHIHRAADFAGPILDSASRNVRIAEVMKKKGYSETDCTRLNTAEVEKAMHTAMFKVILEMGFLDRACRLLGLQSP